MRIIKILFIVLVLILTGCSSNSAKIKSNYTKNDSEFLSNLMNKNFEESEMHLVELQQKYSKMTDKEKCKFHFFKGCFLMAQERYAKGEVELNSCLNINPNYVQALYTRANYYHRVKNELQLASSDLEVLSTLLDLLVEANKNVSNYENFNVSLFVLHPTPSDEFIAANSGEYIRSKPDFASLNTTINNFRRDVLRSIEDLAVDSGDYPKAIECRIKIIDFYRKERFQLFTSYHILGNYYYKMDDYPSALENYEQAVPRTDMESAIHNNIGYCYFQLKSYNDALLNFNRAVSYGARSANIDLSRLSITVETGTSAKEFYRMTKQVEFLCNALFYKARCLEELDYMDEAFATMNQVLSLDEKYTLAHYYRGYYLNAQKERELAVKDFKHALVLDPSLTQLYYSIAVNYDNMDRPSSAKKYYQLYLDSDKKISSKKHKTAQERVEEL